VGHFKRALEGNFCVAPGTNAIVVNSNIDPGTLKRLKRINSSHGKDRRFDPYEKVAVSDEFNANAYYNRGNARMDEGDPNGAIRDFDKAVTLNPQNVLAWNNRGVVRQKTGDLDGALSDFNRAIQLAPRSSMAQTTAGPCSSK
jgi:tetratricopeptide (TPR) repeat protein